MQDEREPDFILAGVSKGATTWIHECFMEHPEIAVPQTDQLGFFNTRYHRGIADFWGDMPTDTDKIIGESSPTYFPVPYAAGRIADHFPDVTLLFCLRNPVERAFSHWWHGYSDRNFTYEFEEMFQNYPGYQMWVTPGFYDYHLKRFERHFDDDQINIVFFDDLVDDNCAFISNIFKIVGADPDFTPSLVGEKSNEAHYQGPSIVKRGRNWVRNNAPGTMRLALSPFVSATRTLLLDRSTYEEGMDPEIRAQLETIYWDEIRGVMERTGRDLSHWFEHVDPPIIDGQ